MDLVYNQLQQHLVYKQKKNVLLKKAHLGKHQILTLKHQT